MLGASVAGVVKLLISEFILLIVIANLVAAPLGYFLLKKLLQIAFVYRIDINPGVFAFAAILTLSIAFFSVIFHTLKAAQANPVDTLQYE